MYFLVQVHFRQKLHIYSDIDCQEELVEGEGVTDEESSDGIPTRASVSSSNTPETILLQ